MSPANWEKDIKASARRTAEGATVGDLVDRLQAIADAATDGPWERGDVWAFAGTGYNGRDDNTCAYCERMGTPEWVGRANINGTKMKAHKHRDPDPWAYDHRISAPDGLVAGNYDYEEGGLIAGEDAAFVATFDPPTVKAILAVVEALSTIRDAHARPDQSGASCAEGCGGRWPCVAWAEADAALAGLEAAVDQ